MKTIACSLLSLAALVAASVGMSSCSDSAYYAGQWQGNPETIQIQGASNAMATITIDFAPTPGEKGRGNVNISAVINASQPASSDGIEQVYEANIVATASASGSYVAEDRDYDDIIFSLNPSSFNVNVERDGVAFAQNALTEAQQPMLDSLTNVTAERWRKNITPVVRDIFNTYSTIEDIKVLHNDILKFEVGHKDYIFKRVGVPD